MPDGISIYFKKDKFNISKPLTRNNLANPGFVYLKLEDQNGKKINVCSAHLASGDKEDNKIERKEEVIKIFNTIFKEKKTEEEIKNEAKKYKNVHEILQDFIKKFKNEEEVIFCMDSNEDYKPTIKAPNDNWEVYKREPISEVEQNYDELGQALLDNLNQEETQLQLRLW